MKQQKTSIFSYLVYILKNNYLIFIYLFVPLLISEYKNTAYLVPLVFIPISIILILLLPKKMFIVDLKSRLDKSIFSKISYYLSQGILLLVNLIITTHTIGEIFYYKVPIFIFLLAIILVVIVVSVNNVDVIINSSTFLFIVSILLIVIPVFLVNDVKDFTLLKPFYKTEDFSLLLIFYFILDAISIRFSNVNLKSKTSKWHLLIPLVIMFIFMSIEILNVIIITGTSYLIDNEFLGFFILFIQDTINYIGNLGLFFLFVIPVVGCFKSSLCLRNIKDGLKIKDNFFTNLLLGIIMFFISFTIIHFLTINKVIFYLILTSTILLFICYFFILINRSDRYEIRF